MNELRRARMERGIVFSGDDVRALLNGSKTQTRRLLKSPHASDADAWAWDSDRGLWESGVCGDSGAFAHGEYVRCPYTRGVSQLWVREKWAEVPVTAYRTSPGVQQTVDPNDRDMCAVYAADWERTHPSWRSSTSMPRWASRITLALEQVRAQRLHQISDDDVSAEGIQMVKGLHETPRHAFHLLWDSIHGDGAWYDNPWVWALTFRRLP